MTDERFHSINDIRKILIAETIRQFQLQGHHLKGDFEEALTVEIANIANRVHFQVRGKKHGVYLDRGVLASKIPYDPTVRTGAGKSQYIEGLINYARLRWNLSNLKEATARAFQIAHKQCAKGGNNGMPTMGSYRFSKNNLRTNFVNETIKALGNNDQLSTLLLDDVTKAVDVIMINEIRNFNAK